MFIASTCSQRHLCETVVRNGRKAMMKNVLMASVLCAVGLAACKVDSSTRFKDPEVVELMIADYQAAINADSHEIQGGIEDIGGENQSVLKITFDRVKTSLKDSSLLRRSKQFSRQLHQQTEADGQFDKYGVLYIIDPDFVEETPSGIISFSMDEAYHAFSKEDL